MTFCGTYQDAKMSNALMPSSFNFITLFNNFFAFIHRFVDKGPVYQFFEMIITKLNRKNMPFSFLPKILKKKTFF